MNLRSQLKDSNIKVVEIVPPTVATDLHRERDNPDDNKKENNPDALSLEEFMDEVTKGWKANEDTVAAGMGNGIVEKWYGAFGEKYAESEKK